MEPTPKKLLDQACTELCRVSGGLHGGHIGLPNLFGFFAPRPQQVGESNTLTLRDPKEPLCRSVRDAIRLKHYSIRTEQAYVNWIKRYIYFHNVRHPAEMGAAEVQAFLTHLAVEGNVAASTQNQALSALLFLYKKVLHQDLGPIDAMRAKKPKRLPSVLTKEEVLSDRGPQMRSHSTITYFRKLGIPQLFSRPRTPNDNPYIESHFATIKTHPAFPGYFADQAKAEDYFDQFYPWYNDVHPHTRLNMLTPNQVHSGQGPRLLAERAALKAATLAARRANPGARTFTMEELIANHLPDVSDYPCYSWMGPKTAPVKKATPLD